VIPHITDEIKHFIFRGRGWRADVAIVEVGGTVGDIESLPFLEAIRQMRSAAGRENACYMHLTLVPYIRTSRRAQDQADPAFGQRSCARSASSPMCCSAAPTARIPDDERRKIALFTNVASRRR
jgi:CTP synthase